MATITRTQNYKAVITINPPFYLLGGTRKHESIWFDSKADAQNWAEGCVSTNKGCPDKKDADIRSEIVERYPKDKRKLSPKQQAFLFFYKHAGFSVAQGETKRQGRARGARELARAEREARELGFTFEWVFDQSGCSGCTCGSSDCDCSTGADHETLGCVVRNDEQEVLASLWGICKPSREYRRVVEAELASEALAGMGVEA